MVNKIPKTWTWTALIGYVFVLIVARENNFCPFQWFGFLPCHVLRNHHFKENRLLLWSWVTSSLIKNTLICAFPANVTLLYCLDSMCESTGVLWEDLWVTNIDDSAQLGQSCICRQMISESMSANDRTGCSLNKSWSVINSMSSRS